MGALGLAVFLSLAGCATAPPRPAAPLLEPGEVPVAARQAEAARRAWLQARPDWAFQGRVAISRGRDGGSGRVDWRQRERVYEVRLSAPVTRQSWRLLGDTRHRGGRLEGLEGGPREGEDAQALLLEATGWEIPVGFLPDWVRGVPADDAVAPESALYGADGRLRRLRQMGWTIDYQDWSFDDEEGRPPLPRRIEADNGLARVRLLVDRWEFGAP
nr:lipoprotein insertase outer membrane protein LolB [Pseudoxanthomonas broegbernensis]